MPKLKRGGGGGGVGVKPQALTLSCLGPAAIQLQSQQAAGLKDRLVLHQWVTHWDMCVVKTFARDRRPARHLVFLPEGPCSLLPRSGPRRVLPSLHSCEPFPYPIGSVGRDEGGMADIPVSPPLLCLSWAGGMGAGIKTKPIEAPGWLLPPWRQLRGPASLSRLSSRIPLCPSPATLRRHPRQLGQSMGGPFPFFLKGGEKDPK